MRPVAKIGAIAFCLALAVSARADAGTLELDTSAITGWHGYKDFNGANLQSTPINARIEYAVYAPGTFTTSPSLQGVSPVSSPTDPSLGVDYVYAYQIFTTSVQGVKDLTMDLLDGAVPVGSTFFGNYSFDPVYGLVPSSQAFITATQPYPRVANVRWTKSTLIGQNLTSDILFFTSKFGPQWMHASITGGGTFKAEEFLPSPVPEPSTVVLAFAGGLFLLAGGYLRRQR